MDAGRRALAAADTIPDLVRLRDRAEGTQNDGADIKLRAERKLGAMLKATVVPRGNHGRVVGASRSLPNGVTKKQSYWWRQVADVSDDIFERYLAETRKSGGELTRAGLLRLWAQLRGPKASPPAQFPQVGHELSTNHVCPKCDYELSGSYKPGRAA